MDGHYLKLNRQKKSFSTNLHNSKIDLRQKGHASVHSEYHSSLSIGVRDQIQMDTQWIEEMQLKLSS